MGTEFEVGRVIDARIFDSIPEFIEFVRDLKSQPAEVEVEKRELAVNGKGWFLNVLNGKRVVGVDGSQLRHLREFGLPFGAVQVVRFGVVHGKGEYAVEYKSKWVGIEHDLDFERFGLEVECLIEEMDGQRREGGNRGEQNYLFYDGSFVLSFVSQLRRDLRRVYIESINRVLEKSEETSTPVFGFVEKSFARDIFGIYYDSLILKDHLQVLEYTEPIICEREVTREYKRKVCFSYLSLNGLFPVRVEFPEWMIDGIESFMKIVAAECMLGSTRNYPYILERAHRYAVIREVEREAIGRIFSGSAGFGTSFKWISKKI